jgi:hypothetical protein
MRRHEARELSAAWVGAATSGPSGAPLASSRLSAPGRPAAHRLVEPANADGPGWGGQVDNARVGSSLCGLAIGAIGRPDARCVGPGLAWAACATIAASTDARRARRRERLGARTTQYEDGCWPAEHRTTTAASSRTPSTFVPEPMHDARKLNESSTILPPRLQFAQRSSEAGGATDRSCSSIALVATASPPPLPMPPSDSRVCRWDGSPEAEAGANPAGASVDLADPSVAARAGLGCAPQFARRS